MGKRKTILQSSERRNPLLGLHTQQENNSFNSATKPPPPRPRTNVCGIQRTHHLPFSSRIVEKPTWPKMDTEDSSTAWYFDSFDIFDPCKLHTTWPRSTSDQTNAGREWWDDSDQFVKCSIISQYIPCRLDSFGIGNFHKCNIVQHHIITNYSIFKWHAQLNYTQGCVCATDGITTSDSVWREVALLGSPAENIDKGWWQGSRAYQGLIRTWKKINIMPK